jgi:transcriptional regulator with XRE-family HTH domain
LTGSDRTGYVLAVAVTERQKRPDVAAARMLIELREQRGLSREALPHAMAMAGLRRDRIPSVKTLWRIEELGHTPSIGVKFALAEFFDRPLHSIWPPHEPRCARSAA